MPSVGERIQGHLPSLAWTIGLALGFLSLFLQLAVPEGMDAPILPSMSWAPSTSLAYFIQLPFITMPDVLPTFLHPDVWALAFGGA
jgi:hypothetical protein